MDSVRIRIMQQCAHRGRYSPPTSPLTSQNSCRQLPPLDLDLDRAAVLDISSLTLTAVGLDYKKEGGLLQPCPLSGSTHSPCPLFSAFSISTVEKAILKCDSQPTICHQHHDISRTSLGLCLQRPP